MISVVGSEPHGSREGTHRTKAHLPKYCWGLLIAHLVFSHLHFSVQLLPPMVRIRYLVIISSIHIEEVQVFVSC